MTPFPWVLLLGVAGGEGVRLPSPSLAFLLAISSHCPLCIELISFDTFSSPYSPEATSIAVLRKMYTGNYTLHYLQTKDWTFSNIEITGLKRPFKTLYKLLEVKEIMYMHKCFNYWSLNNLLRLKVNKALQFRNTDHNQPGCGTEDTSAPGKRGRGPGPWWFLCRCSFPPQACTTETEQAIK